MRQNKGKETQISLKQLFFCKKEKVVLALGGELKANYCIVHSRTAFLHQGFDDLKNPRYYHTYKKNILNEIKTLPIKPQIIAHDLNPLFFSSRLAEGLQSSLLKKSLILPVQHHHAHTVASLAVNNINKEVIAVICDGTGLGDDGRVWGFEFLIAGLKKYKRIGHLNYIPLPGGDMVVKEPWRIAVALLFKKYGNEIFSLDISWLKKKKYKTNILLQMINKKINSPWASSAGRLFDGVSGLIGLCLESNYEAEAALLLEKEAEKVVKKEKFSYPYRLKIDQESFILDTDSLIQSIVNDLQKRERRDIIAARFHNTFSRMIIQMCEKIRAKTALNDVVFSGGVFFNKIISETVYNGLSGKGFNVFKTPDFVRGDSGLSLGQAVIAYVSGGTGKNRKN